MKRMNETKMKKYVDEMIDEMSFGQLLRLKEMIQEEIDGVISTWDVGGEI
tara:strand:- start:2459 stop:2608 length:150 start_codon:yes stop_codon:yes gene_type:complete